MSNPVSFLLAGLLGPFVRPILLALISLPIQKFMKDGPLKRALFTRIGEG